MIRIKESDPPTNVVLSPTVPITCPPSEMSVYLDQSVGLYISDCSVHFTDPLANETITIVALKSSSGFSRIARIVFSAISSPGSPWHGYIPAHCPVCARYNVQDFALLLQFITVARDRNSDSERLLYFGRVITGSIARSANLPRPTRATQRQGCRTPKIEIFTHI